MTKTQLQTIAEEAVRTITNGIVWTMGSNREALDGDETEAIANAILKLLNEQEGNN